MALSLNRSGQRLVWSRKYASADLVEAMGATRVQRSFDPDASLEDCIRWAAILDVAFTRYFAPPTGVTRGTAAYADARAKQIAALRRFDPKYALKAAIFSGMADDPEVLERDELLGQKFGGIDPRNGRKRGRGRPKKPVPLPGIVKQKKRPCERGRPTNAYSLLEEDDYPLGWNE